MAIIFGNVQNLYRCYFDENDNYRIDMNGQVYLPYSVTLPTGSIQKEIQIDFGEAPRNEKKMMKELSMRWRQKSEKYKKNIEI